MFISIGKETELWNWACDDGTKNTEREHPFFQWVRLQYISGKIWQDETLFSSQKWDTHEKFLTAFETLGLANLQNYKCDNQE
jgi:hypothetical protein